MPLTETQVDQRRIALVVVRTLTPGQTANVSALLMGQLALLEPSVYASAVIEGADGLPHAAIRHSTVVLRARAGQLVALAHTARQSEMAMCVFTALGQSLHNRFEDYETRLRQETAELVGVGLAGSDQRIRAATKKFSLVG